MNENRMNKQRGVIGITALVSIVALLVVGGGVTYGVVQNKKHKTEVEMQQETKYRVDYNDDSFITSDSTIDIDIDEDVSVDAGVKVDINDVFGEGEKEEEKEDNQKTKQNVSIFLTATSPHFTENCLDETKSIEQKIEVYSDKGILRTTLTTLFAFNPREKGMDEQIGNFTYNKGLSIEDLYIENRTAYAILNSSSNAYTSECQKEWTKEAITNTAKQFSTVDSAVIYLNGERL